MTMPIDADNRILFMALFLVHLRWLLVCPLLACETDWSLTTPSLQLHNPGCLIRRIVDVHPNLRGLDRLRARKESYPSKSQRVSDDKSIRHPLPGAPGPILHLEIFSSLRGEGFWV